MVSPSRFRSLSILITACSICSYRERREGSMNSLLTKVYLSWQRKWMRFGNLPSVLFSIKDCNFIHYQRDVLPSSLYEWWLGRLSLWHSQSYANYSWASPWDSVTRAHNICLGFAPRINLNSTVHTDLQLQHTTLRNEGETRWVLASSKVFKRNHSVVDGTANSLHHHIRSYTIWTLVPPSNVS